MSLRRFFELSDDFLRFACEEEGGEVDIIGIGIETSGDVVAEGV